jgi:hypothetical protein
MHCQTCKEEVPSKFAHAIRTNTCPFCGDLIMSEKLQIVLADLKVALDDAKEFPAEVEDFLLSNYSLKKFDPNEIISQPNTTINRDGSFSLVNPKPGSKPIAVRRAGDTLEEDSNMTDFARRAGVKTNLKRVVEDIQGAASPDEFIGQDTEYGAMIDDSNIAPLDQRGANELQGLFDENNPILELEKLKRLRNAGMSDGKIRRE